MIRLTEYESDAKMLMNPEHIICVERIPKTSWTTIRLPNGYRIDVQETFEEIEKLLAKWEEEK